jgi:hypothetical protein
MDADPKVSVIGETLSVRQAGALCIRINLLNVYAEIMVDDKEKAIH